MESCNITRFLTFQYFDLCKEFIHVKKNCRILLCLILFTVKYCLIFQYIKWNKNIGI